MSKYKKVLVYFLATLLMLSGISQVYAGNLNELKKEQKGIDQRLKDKKGEMKTMMNQKNDVQAEIQELDRKIDEANEEIEAAELQIEELQKDIEILEEELAEAELELEEKNELFNKRIRVMYMNGETSYLEMLLTSKDIKDFLSKKEVLQSIAEHDKELIRYMKEQKTLIDNKKTALEGQRASVEATKAQLISRREEFDKVSREKSDLMGRLEADIEALESEYDKLNDYAKSIESQIYKLQTVTGPYTGGAMTWPVPASTRINSYFGYRLHPVLKVNKLHTGLDIGAGHGSNIVAAEAGTVIYSGWLGSYGKVAMIDHGGGIVTLYAHASSVLVSKGQKVEKGQSIARVGSTGMSTGPHLHFEVRKNGSYVDPMGWLKGN